MRPKGVNGVCVREGGGGVACFLPSAPGRNWASSDELSPTTCCLSPEDPAFLSTMLCRLFQKSASVTKPPFTTSPYRCFRSLQNDPPKLLTPYLSAGSHPAFQGAVSEICPCGFRAPPVFHRTPPWEHGGQVGCCFELTITTTGLVTLGSKRAANHPVQQA